MSRVLEIYKEGYNCAETLIKAVNEEKDLNIPVSIASPFGSGMTVGSTCGAITGLLMVIGAINGREQAIELNNSKRYTKEIMNKIKKKYGTFECIELKKKGVPCKEIIKYAYELLKEYID